VTSSHELAEPESAEPVAHGVSSFSMPSAPLDHVYRTVGEYFPEIVSETVICLSVAATLLLEDQQNPVALNLEGVPSSLKTTLIDFFDGAEDKCYRSDKFTPKSFVSHSASISRERLAEVDLLPRIRHKVFLVPELAPLFGLRNEDLLESFAILTRVLDGQGLSTDSGIHGRRGHTGDYLFAWIGGTTPIPHNVWKTMGKLGSRFLFIEMPADEYSDEELVRAAAGGTSYRGRLDVCRVAVAVFLEALWQATGGVRGVAWDRSADPQEILLRIAAFAKVLARLRGTISIWREGSGDEETYNFSTPVIEGPQRAMSLLYALARGHALVHGRSQLAADDLPIVARAALESTPNDRRAVMRLLLAHDGLVTSPQVQEALRCSAPTSRAILETLDKLGLGRLENPGPPVTAALRLDDQFRWLLPLKKSRRREGTTGDSASASGSEPLLGEVEKTMDKTPDAPTSLLDGDLDEDEIERLAQLSVQAQETGGPKDVDVDSKTLERIAELSPGGEWLARDGIWRSRETYPPLPGEVVDTRDGRRDPVDDLGFDEELF
jgi:hypothetical protein